MKIYQFLPTSSFDPPCSRVSIKAHPWTKAYSKHAHTQGVQCASLLAKQNGRGVVRNIYEFFFKAQSPRFLSKKEHEHMRYMRTLSL